MKKETAELTIAKMEKEIAKCDKIITRVRANMENIAKGYMAIAADIKRINDTRAWELYEGQEGYADEYKGLSAFCYDVFGISQAMCSRLVKISEAFIDEKYQIKGEWAGYSMSALHLLSSVPEKKLVELPVSPSMTIKELTAVVGDSLPVRKRKVIETEIKDDLAPVQEENVSRETYAESEAKEYNVAEVAEEVGTVDRPPLDAELIMTGAYHDLCDAINILSDYLPAELTGRLVALSDEVLQEIEK